MSDTVCHRIVISTRTLLRYHGIGGFDIGEPRRLTRKRRGLPDTTGKERFGRT